MSNVTGCRSTVEFDSHAMFKREPLAEQPDIAQSLITHRFPIEDAAEAFRVGRDKGSGDIRVVIEP